jgi:hypothetical protein
MEVGLEGMVTILLGFSGVIVHYLYCRCHFGIVA